MSEPKITPNKTEHTMFVQSPDNAFAGYDTNLTIVKYTKWSEVSLTGGARQEGDDPINRVPIDVLRQIIKIHDSLP